MGRPRQSRAARAESGGLARGDPASIRRAPAPARLPSGAPRFARFARFPGRWRAPTSRRGHSDAPYSAHRARAAGSVEATRFLNMPPLGRTWGPKGPPKSPPLSRLTQFSRGRAFGFIASKKRTSSFSTRLLLRRRHVNLTRRPRRACACARELLRTPPWRSRGAFALRARALAACIPQRATA